MTKTLVDDSGKVVDQIVFGIGTLLFAMKRACLNAQLGGLPKFTPNPLRPTLDDPDVCKSSMSTVLATVKVIFSDPTYRQRSRPLLTAISTTGMSAKRDIPVAMIPLYHWMLGAAHADKKVMEEDIEKAKGEGVLRDFVIVKPSLLVGEKKLGKEKIRIGLEGEGVFEPAIGYTISREDVGGFIFEEVVDKQDAQYFGKKVSITY